MINPSDVINALFEAFGAWAIWCNVARIRKDRAIKGVVWQYTAVYWLWGCWNLFYYPNLGQWFSTVAGVAVTLGNLTWLIYALKVVRAERRSLEAA